MLAVGYDAWQHVLKKITDNLPDQVEVVGEEKLNNFYDFRRERNMEHMVFLAEWESRLEQAEAVAGTPGAALLNYFGKTYWLFRCGRYGKEARRWILQLIEGTHEVVESHLHAL